MGFVVKKHPSTATSVAAAIHLGAAAATATARKIPAAHRGAVTAVEPAGPLEADERMGFPKETTKKTHIPVSRPTWRIIPGLVSG